MKTRRVYNYRNRESRDLHRGVDVQANCRDILCITLTGVCVYMQFNIVCCVRIMHLCVWL